MIKNVIYILLNFEKIYKQNRRSDSLANHFKQDLIKNLKVTAIERIVKRRLDQKAIAAFWIKKLRTLEAVRLKTTYERKS